MKTNRWLALLLLPLLLWSLCIPAAAIGFLDVKPGDWHYESVRYMVRRGFIFGTAPAVFSPNEGLTRGQLVTILGRMDGSEAQWPQSSFADVEPGAYYERYVDWGAANGLLDVTDGYFRPDALITRQEAAILVDHFVKYISLDLPAPLAFRYEDDAEISEAARSAVQNLWTSSLMRGYQDGYFRPNDTLKRAEGVTLLMPVNQLLYQQIFSKAIESGAIFPKSITVSAPQYYLNAGDTVQLNVNISPANATERGLFFTSGNATILTVDQNGLVTAVGEGSSYIEVMPPNGRWETISFTVRGGTPGVTNSTIDALAFDQRYNEALSIEIVRLIGIERAKRGLGGIQYASYLQPGATLRADEMQIMGNAKHVRPDGTRCKTAFIGLVSDHLQMAECGLTMGMWKAPFNAAEMTPEYMAALAVKTWMGSPDHAKVLLWTADDTVDAACAISVDSKNYRIYVSYCPYFGEK